MLDGGVLPGCVERGLGNADRGSEPSYGERNPLVRRQFGLFAGHQSRHQTLAQSEELRFEVSGFIRGDGVGKLWRQLHSRCRQFQRIPRDVGAADELYIGKMRSWGYASGSEP